MRSKKERLGIIGGAGPYASALLYKLLLDELYKSKKEVFEMLIVNYPFTHPYACRSVQEWDHLLQKELQECVDTLLSTDIAVAVVVCNTLHSYLDKIKGGVQFIHLPNTVIKRIISEKTSKLLILGTAVTKRDGLYSHPNYQSLYPDEQGQHKVDLAINHVLNGTPTKEDARLMEKLVESMYEKEKIDGVVLGCTELPVLHSHYPLKTACKLFDSIEILAHHLSERGE